MDALSTIRFTLNGAETAIAVPPLRRLTDVLRLDLGLTGTKVGCEAGDCGACTVLLDHQAVCACLIPVAQVAGRSVRTVEGLANGALNPLQRAFHHYGAAQCGICTPGMLMAATALLERSPAPTEAETLDALGGVLCRCTGYRKIVTAVMQAHRFTAQPAATAAETRPNRAVGARLRRLDGAAKIDGSERFGDDVAPADALWLKVLRAPYASARFSIGDLRPVLARHPGIERILTAADIPGVNVFGVIPSFRDQPVLAEAVVRFRGEAIAAAVGTREAVAAIEVEDLPVTWEPLPPLATMDQALAADAPLMFTERPGNILTGGYVKRGDLDAGFAAAAAVVEGTFETSFVEHAYIEPEAGFARRAGDRIEVHVTTQTPYMDREEVARVLGVEQERVRIIPTACGGGFGGKLDVSIQPLIALAAWLLDRPVRCVYGRPESMATTTKRHPAVMRAKLAADAEGRLLALHFEGDFNTGAYASWGPTVATRVPVHCSGPYVLPAIEARTRAVLTNLVPSGAFRGFGTPQAAIATEALMDELADALGIDRLEFRLRNAIRRGDTTASGQVLHASVGMATCLEVLKPHWQALRAAAATANADERTGVVRHGVGVACMWYGCGNTALSNPSTIGIGLQRSGRVLLLQGAVDIGQGSNTVIAQIAADALGVDVGRIDLITGDTGRTADAGKTSASRQTFVSGQAAVRAADALRRQVLRLANAGEGATIAWQDGCVTVTDGGIVRRIDLSALPADGEGLVLRAEGTFDPPTTTLDENGQGTPYATYAFGAQVAAVTVDTGLGTVKVTRMVAAHDVGRAVNPTLVEGQVEGGIAQGLGMALMEEYIPGRNDNLHDYLIPTVGDIPEIETLLIEDPEPLGPFGAKGVGEPALIPTAAAILNAIRDAIGITVRRVPATPDRLRALILDRRDG